MDFVAYSAAFNSHQNAIMHYGVKGMKWGVRKDAQLLAERQYNVEKKDLKQQLKLNKIDRSTYRMKKKRAKYGMLSEKYRTNKFIKENKKDQQALYDKYMELHSKAVKDIPHYKIKSGAKTAGRILGKIGTIAAVSAVPINLFMPTAEALRTATMGEFIASYLGLSAIGSGAAYVGSRKIRKGANAVRRKFT